MWCTQTQLHFWMNGPTVAGMQMLPVNGCCLVSLALSQSYWCLCVRAHDLPNINCFLAENLRENHEMLDHLHSKGSQEFWDQWFWSLIFEDFSRVHPLSHRSQTQLLLKNIAVVARVLWVSHIPPSSMGMGQAERCTILLSISTYWCIPFLFWIFGKQDEAIHSAACKNRVSFVGTVTSGQPVVYASDYLTFILLSHGSSERTLHSCWIHPTFVRYTRLLPLNLDTFCWFIPPRAQTATCPALLEASCPAVAPRPIAIAALWHRHLRDRCHWAWNCEGPMGHTCDIFFESSDASLTQIHTCMYIHIYIKKIYRIYI